LVTWGCAARIDRPLGNCPLESIEPIGKSSKIGSAAHRRGAYGSQAAFGHSLDVAGATGELRRVFIRGSFVTAKPAPGDLDILLIMGEGFEVDRTTAQARSVFDSVRAKLRFEADVFRARTSIGDEIA
jgi:hypothetical protein